ncbi:cytochrome c oxidase subunit 3 [Ideonella sp. BN130291]|uniref:cytochrome c oxidase subunit 3 n=1 Tax=Ideonella sp. BN130291 TaxID=3112940 RepID=UPI002E276E9B|nr:cytochrome c oxidase subunit 3 [Ideonella sp. BN130291]
MTASTAALRAAGRGDDLPAGPRAAGSRRQRPGAAADIGLWVFIGFASTLFTLFLIAYVMRAVSNDWSPIGMPWQLWLSTAVLAAGSGLLHAAAVAARRRHGAQANALVLGGGVCALLFIGVQLWAWATLMGARVTPAGNPAASFFYLLTAMHGLHVLGGLLAWGWLAWSLRQQADAAVLANRIRLCARYWHFLLLLWGVLFAAMGLLTPDLARALCGVR